MMKKDERKKNIYGTHETIVLRILVRMNSVKPVAEDGGGCDCELRPATKRFQHTTPARVSVSTYIFSSIPASFRNSQYDQRWLASRRESIPFLREGDVSASTPLEMTPIVLENVAISRTSVWKTGFRAPVL